MSEKEKRLSHLVTHSGVLGTTILGVLCLAYELEKVDAITVAERGAPDSNKIVAALHCIIWTIAEVYTTDPKKVSELIVESLASCIHIGKYQCHEEAKL